MYIIDVYQESFHFTFMRNLCGIIAAKQCMICLKGHLTVCCYLMHYLITLTLVSELLYYAAKQ